MKILFPFLLLVFIACEAPNNNTNTPITPKEKQIAKDLIQGAFDDLWGGCDSTKILDYHTEDFVILEHGEIWDNARIKKYMRKQLANKNRAKRINKMDYLSIDKYGPSMQIAYYNFADFVKADTIEFKARWLESAVAVETEKGWRLKMMHSTRAFQKQK